MGRSTVTLSIQGSSYTRERYGYSGLFVQEPNGEPWPEAELDEKFVVASIDQFQTALDCLNSRLLDTNTFIDEANILEYSERRNTLDELSNTSSPGCYSNRSVQNQTKLDRNENDQNSRFCNIAQNSLNKSSHCVQLIESDNKKQKKFETEQVVKRKEKNMEKKLKKTTEIENKAGNQNQLLERVTETTFHRTRTLKRGTTQGHESDGSDWEMPQIEWRKVTPQRRNEKYHHNQ